MLVLSRKAREELIFPEYGIVLTILEVHGNRVRVGIAAPKDIKVLRREVLTSADKASSQASLEFAKKAGSSSERSPQ